MKTILVDAIWCFVSNRGEIFGDMHDLLDGYQNRKIILTGANDEEFKKFRLSTMPYEAFILKHNPEKTNLKYYEMLLAHFGLIKDDVIYFEHNPDAVKSAQSVGIVTYHYDDSQKDLIALKKFLDENVN